MLFGTRRALLSRPPVAAASGGWWVVPGQTVVAAYCPKGAADLAASYVNLANPGTYDLTTASAPAWNVVTGWTFTTDHLLTGIAPGTSRTFSMIVRFANCVHNTGGTCLAGAVVTSAPYAEFRVTARYKTDTEARYSNGGFVTTASGRATGVIAIAGTQGYIDGSADGAAVGAVAGSIPAISIGRRGGTNDEPYSGDVLAVAIYSTTLSASDVASLTTLMQNL